MEANICYLSIRKISGVFIMFAVFFLQSNLFSQGDEGCDGIDTIRDNQLQRDRAYPFGVDSTNPMVDALEHLQYMVQTDGNYINASQWVSIGPTPYYEHGIARTGRIAFVKYYPDYNAHSGWIYVGGHQGGLWKSTNNGSSFLPITDGLESQVSGSMAFDPINPNIIYYATGGNLYNYTYNYYGLGVYKSTDAGATWTGPYRNGLPTTPTIFSFKIAVSPVSNENGYHDIYLANGADPFYEPYYGYQLHGGLYKSTDGGITWAIAPGTNDNTACNDVVISDDGTHIYASGMYNFGFWRSTNSGDNFQRLNNNGLQNGRRTQIALSSDESIIYV